MLSDVEKQAASVRRMEHEQDLYPGATITIKAVHPFTDDAGNPMIEVLISRNI